MSGVDFGGGKSSRPIQSACVNLHQLAVEIAVEIAFDGLIRRDRRG